MLLYGPGGIGKSTWGAKTPAPIFLGSEEGTDLLDVARFPKPKSFEDILTGVRELIEAAHEYKTLVIDSLDWIEPLIYAAVCKRYGVSSIEKAAGGYGKGYLEALDEWTAFMDLLTALRDKRKMNIVLLAHPSIENHTDPHTQATYQRYELKLNKKAKQKVMEYVDAMFYATYETFTKKDGDTVKAVVSDRRVMYPNWQQGFDAKNRYGLQQEIDLAISWEDFIKLCNIVPKPPVMSAEEVDFHVKNLLPQIKDEETRKRAEEAITKAGGDLTRLTMYVEKLKALTLN